MCMAQQRNALSYKWRYAIYGAIFGFFFPIIATILCITEHNLAFNLSGIIEAQKCGAPLLFIIDTAPIFLGLFASFAGRRQDTLVAEINERIQIEIELKKYRDQLEELVKERTVELEEAQKQLLESAHKAGMAEIATNVLHNIGNVLNSAITSTVVIGETVRGSKLNTYEKLVEMIESQKSDFAEFVAKDPKGQKIPDFLIQLNTAFKSEQDKITAKLKGLSRSHEHIREIIGLQQTYAGVKGMEENVSLPEIVSDAAHLFGASFDRHNIDFTLTPADDVPKIKIQKNKAIQIFINLLKNGRDAVKENGRDSGKIEVRFHKLNDKFVQVDVIDNGIGIEQDKLTKIFHYGFTTKSTGHGFGLHGSANLATELGGNLSATSEGKGKGATFSLKLPIKAEVPKE